MKRNHFHNIVYVNLMNLKGKMSTPIHSTDPYIKIQSNYSPSRIDQTEQDENNDIEKEEWVGDSEKLRKELLLCNIIDENGLPIRPLEDLNPLGKEEIEKIDNLLKTKREFIGSNNFSIHITPYELLKEIHLRFKSVIDEMLIVGGAVNECLTKNFVVENFKKINLNHCINEENIKFIFEPTKDLDIRIKLNHGIPNYPELYALIQNVICHFLAERYFSKSNPSIDESKYIWFNAFNKKKSCATNFSIFSLVDTSGWRLEIFISHCFNTTTSNKKDTHYLRQFLFLSDALSIPIKRFFLNSAPKYIVLKTYVDSGWTALFAKLTKVIGCREIETMDRKAFASYLAKINKGYIDPYIDSSDLLSLRFFEINNNLDAKGLFFYFKHAFINHLENLNNDVFSLNANIFNALFLAISFISALEDKYDKNVIKALIAKIVSFIYKINGNNFLDPLAEDILKLLNEEKVNVAFIIHFLSIKSLGIYLSESCMDHLKVEKKIHAKKTVLQLSLYKAHILLTFDYAFSLPVFYKQLNHLKDQSIDFSLFPFIKIQEILFLKKEGLDEQLILTFAELLLKNEMTCKLGYGLLQIYFKLNPKDCDYILQKLPQIIELFGIKEIENIKKEMVSVGKLCFIFDQLDQELEIVDFLLHYIEILLSVDSYRYIGWQLYEKLKIGVKEKEEFTKLLFHKFKFKNFNLAKALFSKLHLNNYQKSFYLLILFRSAFAIGETLDPTEMQLAMLHSINKNMSKNKSILWLKICHELCICGFFQSSYELWKKGIGFLKTQILNEVQYYKNFQKYLLDLIKVLHLKFVEINDIWEIISSLKSYLSDDFLQKEFVSLLLSLAQKKPLDALKIFTIVDQTFYLRLNIYTLYRISFKNIGKNYCAISLSKTILKLLILEYKLNEYPLNQELLLSSFFRYYKEIPIEEINFIADEVGEFFSIYLKRLNIRPDNFQELVNFTKIFNEFSPTLYTDETKKLLCEILKEYISENNFCEIKKLAFEGPLKNLTNLSEEKMLAKLIISHAFNNLLNNKDEILENNFYELIIISLDVLEKKQLKNFLLYFIEQLRFELAINLLKEMSHKLALTDRKRIFQLFKILIFTENKIIYDDFSFFLSTITREIIENLLYERIKNFKKINQCQECLNVFKVYEVKNFNLWKILIETQLSLISLHFNFITLKDKKIYLGRLESIHSFLKLSFEKKITPHNNALKEFIYRLIKEIYLPTEIYDIMANNFHFIFENNFSYDQINEISKLLIFNLKRSAIKHNYENLFVKIYNYLIENSTIETIDFISYKNLIKIFLELNEFHLYKKSCESLGKYLWVKENCYNGIVLALLNKFGMSLQKSKHFNSVKKNRAFIKEIQKLIEIIPNGCEMLHINEFMKMTLQLEDRDTLIIAAEYMIQKSWNHLNKSSERKESIEILEAMQYKLANHAKDLKILCLYEEINKLLLKKVFVESLRTKVIYLSKNIFYGALKFLKWSWTYYQNFRG